MNKSITCLLLCSSSLFAAQIYSQPSEESKVISTIDTSHEYSIKTQDWVEITDQTTNQTGWIKLSEMKASLSQNSQWSYNWSSTAKGSEQTMHYKPYSEKDIHKQIQKIHHQHKKIMSTFDSFWEEFEDPSTDQA